MRNPEVRTNVALKHPPRPRLTLNVGITGHRANVLPDELADALHDRLSEIFVQLRETVLQLHAADSSLFAEDAPSFRLHSGLATGADQIAALSASDNSFYVRALLPFPSEEYARDFTKREEHIKFQEHLGTSDEIFALPGCRTAEDAAYVLVGKGIIAASDILIAVWDGGKGNGPGGTAHVVDLALRAGVAVLHVPFNREARQFEPVRLITGGDAIEPIHEPLGSEAQYERLIRDILWLENEQAKAALSHYYRETEILINRRIEYPVMLWLLGIKKLGKHPWRQQSIAQNMQERIGGSRDKDDSHFAAYNWANFLAIRCAQRFRSGHVTNYLLAALAVLVALSGLFFPAAKPFLVAGELVIIYLLFSNTRYGMSRDWHRRWLQYRHLAESLRPLAYLKRTGLSAPPFRNSYAFKKAGTATPDWTRWYATAIWREMTNPVGVVDEDMVRQLADEIRTEQIAPQIAYHKFNAERMQHLDHQLHEVGNFLMGAVIAACACYLVGYFVAYEFISEWTYFFVFVTAGFPALGAAVFGLRGHGEHLLTASRSRSTINSLTVNDRRIASLTELEELNAELEKTAEIMLEDLGEWNVAYSERALQVPA